MKKITLIIISFFLISYVSLSQDTKIGYTSIDVIIQYLPEFKGVQSEIQAYGTQLQNQIVAKENDFRSKLEDYQRTRETLNDIIRADKEQELQTLNESIQKFQSEAQASMVRKEQEVLEPLINKIQNAINTVAERENYSHVLEAPPGGGVLIYAKESFNITNLVFAELGIDPPSGSNE